MSKHFKTSIGGQALIEGVMMRGPRKTAMAVRKPDGELETRIWDNKPARVWNRIPLVRGVVNMVSSLVVGYRCLMKSAEISTEGLEEEEPSRLEKWLRRHLPQTPKGERTGGRILAFALPVGTLVISGGLCWLFWWIHPLLGLALQILWCWQAGASRTRGKSGGGIAATMPAPIPLRQNPPVLVLWESSWQVRLLILASGWKSPTSAMLSGRSSRKIFCAPTES